MPSYITKNENNGNPYTWKVPTLVPQQFDKLDCFNITQPL